MRRYDKYKIFTQALEDPNENVRKTASWALDKVSVSMNAKLKMNFSDDQFIFNLPEIISFGSDGGIIKQGVSSTKPGTSGRHTMLRRWRLTSAYA